MQRLLKDATELSGIEYSIGSFADIIEAIHVVQDELGITGTTALEASTTIEGSFNMLKSAWANMLTGVANDSANFDELINDLIYSAKTFGENILPRIKIAIQGIGELIRELLPQALNKIPELLASLFPESMQKDIRIIFEKIAESIQTTADIAMQLFPKIIEGLAWILNNGNTIISIVSGISATIIAFKTGAVITKVIQSWQQAKLALALYSMTAENATVKQGVMNGVFSAWETLVALFTGKITLAQLATIAWSKAQAILNGVLSANPIGIILVIITALTAGIIYLWKTNEGFRNAIIKSWESIKETAINVWGYIVNFVTVTIPQAFNSIVEFLKNNWQGILLLILNPFVGAFKLVYDNSETFRKFINELVNNILSTFKTWGENIKNFFHETIPKLIQNIVNWFNELPYKIGYSLGYTLAAIFKWGQDSWNYLKTNVPLWIKNIENYFSQLPAKIEKWLIDTYNKIVKWGTDTWNNIVKDCSKIITSVENYFSQLPAKIEKWLTDTYNNTVAWGKNMYNKAVQTGSNFINSIMNYFKQLPTKIETELNNLIKRVTSFANNLEKQATDAGKNMVKGLWNGITNMGKWIDGKIKSFFNGIIDGAKAALGIHSPSRVFRDEVGKYMAQGVGVGFEDETKNVQQSMEKDFECLVAKMSAVVDYETSMTTARVIAHNNSISGGVDIDDNNPKENPITVVAKFIVDGKEFTQTVVAPNQDVLTDYYEGR